MIVQIYLQIYKAKLIKCWLRCYHRSKEAHAGWLLQVIVDIQHGTQMHKLGRTAFHENAVVMKKFDLLWDEEHYHWKIFTFFFFFYDKHDVVWQ